MALDRLVHRRGFLGAVFVGLAGLVAVPVSASAQALEPGSDTVAPEPEPSATVPEPIAPPELTQPAVDPPDAGPTTDVDPPDAGPTTEPEFFPYGAQPVRLAIPMLDVDASVMGVAQDADGSMAVPDDPDRVAWYSLGPGMGVGGNVVFAAHINWDGVPRVFGRLDRLEPGDAVLVVDAEGDGYEYRVESTRWVRAEGAPIEEIFDQADGPIITLITCGGEYRAATREYLDRLVVRARGA